MYYWLKWSGIQRKARGEMPVKSNYIRIYREFSYIFFFILYIISTIRARARDGYTSKSIRDGGENVPVRSHRTGFAPVKVHSPPSCANRIQGKDRLLMYGTYLVYVPIKCTYNVHSEQNIIKCSATRDRCKNHRGKMLSFFPSLRCRFSIIFDRSRSYSI